MRVVAESGTVTLLSAQTEAFFWQEFAKVTVGTAPIVSTGGSCCGNLAKAVGVNQIPP